MESQIIVKILSDKSCVFQRNVLESRHLLICLPELAVGKLRYLWAGQLRDLWAGQQRDLGAGQSRSWGLASKEMLVLRKKDLLSSRIWAIRYGNRGVPMATRISLLKQWEWL